MATEVPLPSAKGRAKINVVHFDVRDAVVKMLTDPRLSDEDFLHFNQDPLAAPPNHVDSIGKNHTTCNLIHSTCATAQRVWH